MAEAVRDGLRLEAIAADIVGDGDAALESLSVNSYDLAVLDRDIPGPPATRSPGASSPPAAASRSSCWAWDENTNPFTNTARITVSALRKRLGEPWIIATVAGVGYRIDTGAPDRNIAAPGRTYA